MTLTQSIRRALTSECKTDFAKIFGFASPTLKDRLDAIRNKMDLSWEQLAINLNLSVSALMMARRGERNFSQRSLYRLTQLEAQGLSQAQIGQRLGVTRGYLNAVLNGRRQSKRLMRRLKPFLSHAKRKNQYA